jgi:hypothetical protein
MSDGWYGVDLDGTLAEYGTANLSTVLIVKQWLAEGKDVRIFTARANDGNLTRRAIAAWCIYHLGKELPITATKDFDMVESRDDRAVQVIPNTGERADGKQ